MTSESTPHPDGAADGARAGASPAPSGFFAWLRDLGIVRGSDRWFAGVAGGIAARAGIDPLLVRGAFVVLALIGGPGLLLYIAGWLLLPDASGRIHAEEIVRGRASAGILTAAIVCVAVFVLPGVLGVLFGSTSPLGGLWGWDVWSAIGVPEWVRVTSIWLFWIAAAVAGFVGLRALLRRQGAAAAGAAGAAGGPAAGAGAAPGAAAPGSGSATGPGSGSTSPGAACSAGGSDHAAGSARSFAEQADDWGRRIGESAAEWGERVGRRAEEWGARSAEQAEARRLGAAHTVLTLAAALIAGGAAALWALGPGAGAATTTEAPAALVAALIAGVVVLAVSVIWAGVRGRSTGWVGFLAACGVVALFVTAVLPWDSRFAPVGTARIDAASQPRSTVMLAGEAHIDLTALDGVVAGSGDTAADAAAADAADGLSVWLLAGDATVELPDAAPVIVEVRVLAGNVAEPEGGGTRVSGPFLHRTVTNLPAGASAAETADAARVAVTVVAGSVAVEGGSTTTGSAVAGNAVTRGAVAGGVTADNGIAGSEAVADAIASEEAAR